VFVEYDLMLIHDEVRILWVTTRKSTNCNTSSV